MSQVRYFNTAYVGDRDIGPWLDALIYLANPSEKEPAHITVQGPYNIESEARDALPRGLTGAWVHVLALRDFFADGQNTVYLHCDSPAIAKHWFKPSGFTTQHLTVYDGPSRAFAAELKRVCGRIDWSFPLQIGRVATIRSVKGEPRADLRDAVDRSLLGDVVACRPDHASILGLKDRSQLSAIERVCNRIASTLAARGPMLRAAIA
jgi:hypothetical protein